MHYEKRLRLLAKLMFYYKTKNYMGVVKHQNELFNTSMFCIKNCTQCSCGDDFNKSNMIEKSFFALILAESLEE